MNSTSKLIDLAILALINLQDGHLNNPQLHAKLPRIRVEDGAQHDIAMGGGELVKLGHDEFASATVLGVEQHDEGATDRRR